MLFSNKGKSNAILERSPLLIKVIMLILLSLCLTICWKIGNQTSYKSVIKNLDNTNELEKKLSFLDISSTDKDISADEAIRINLNSYEDEVEITEGGKYILSGSIEGCIKVEAKDQTVHLFMDGVIVNSKVGPALHVVDAEKIIITLVEGSRNSISDSGKYQNSSDAVSCIYSESNITFNGSGLLEVYGLFKDAIRTKDVLKIVDGTYKIHCKRTALRGNDGIHVAGGNIFVSSEKYGLKTKKSGSDGRGDILISAGKLSIVDGRNAFVTTKGNLYIYNAILELNSVVSDFDIKGVTVIDDGCIQ